LNFVLALLQTIVALAAVCGLAYLIFRVILPRLQMFGEKTSGLIRVVERIPIDTRHNLLVVEIAGKWLVLSASDTGLNLICELEAENAAAAEKEVNAARAAAVAAAEKKVGNWHDVFAAKKKEIKFNDKRKPQ
jgi:flagellar biosynthetic protein FliO